MIYSQHARVALEDGLTEAKRALDLALKRLKDTTAEMKNASEHAERAAERVKGLEVALAGQPEMSLPITDIHGRDALLTLPDRTARH